MQKGSSVDTASNDFNAIFQQTYAPCNSIDYLCNGHNDNSWNMHKCCGLLAQNNCGLFEFSIWMRSTWSILVWCLMNVSQISKIASVLSKVQKQSLLLRSWNLGAPTKKIYFWESPLPTFHPPAATVTWKVTNNNTNYGWTEVVRNKVQNNLVLKRR